MKTREEIRKKYRIATDGERFRVEEYYTNCPAVLHWRDYWRDYGFTERESAMAKTIDRLLVALYQVRPESIQDTGLEGAALTLLAEYVKEQQWHPVTVSIIDRMRDLGLVAKDYCKVGSKK